MHNSPFFAVDMVNVRGLHSNFLHVQYHLGKVSPDLLFLTETQIKPPADESYLGIPGYRLESKFVAKAGVCLYVRSDICCRRLRAYEDPEWSALWAHVALGSQTRIYVCIYRSHSGDLNTTRLFNYLDGALETAQRQYPSAELVVLGDFNAHHVEWLRYSRTTDHAGREAYSFALSHGLTQLVNEPTRVPNREGHCETLLDLLLTDNASQYKVWVEMKFGGSDHRLVRASVPRLPPPRNAPTKRRVWHYRSADWDGLREFYASYP